MNINFMPKDENKLSISSLQPGETFMDKDTGKHFLRCMDGLFVDIQTGGVYVANNFLPRSQYKKTYVTSVVTEL